MADKETTTRPSYDIEYQKTLINFMISDKESFSRVQNIVKDVYFEDALGPVVRCIMDYASEYKDVPNVQQIKAMTLFEAEIIPDAGRRIAWFLDAIEGFCRYRALEECILEGYQMIQRGEAGDIERRLKDALTISLMSDLGSNVFEDVKGKLERLKDKSNYVTTGWKTIDDKLYGGFTRGSLNVFCGGSGAGKSLFLQNMALNWSAMGKTVLYVTLELSEDLTNMRLYSMLSKVPSYRILKEINAVALAIECKRKETKPGLLYVKKFPEAGTTANTLRAYMKEFEIETGRKPDALVVDYLDLMHPNNSKLDVSSLFTKDKYVSEEMRSIGGEWDIPVVTASQLNRSAVDAQEFDHSHIAGGISKINTADNVMGIYTSMTKREQGVYELQFLKTRSAAAVGQKCELAFDPETLLITDKIDEDEYIPVMNNRSTGEVAHRMSGEEAPPAPPSIRDGITDMLTRYKRPE